MVDNKYKFSGYSLILFGLLILYFIIVKGNLTENNDSIKLIQLIIERIHLLPNSSIQWTGEAFVSLVSYPLMFMGIIFPKLIDLFVYKFLDETYTIVDFLRVIEGLTIFGLYFLINDFKYQKTFLLLTLIYFFSGHLLELNLSVISSYFLLLFLYSKNQTFYSISCANKALNVFFLIPFILSDKEFSRFNWKFFLTFFLILSPTIILHPVFFLKGFLGDIYAKIFIFSSTGSFNYKLFLIGLIGIFFIYNKIRSTLGFGKLIITTLLLLVYAYKAQYLHYLFPIIVWALYLNFGTKYIYPLFFSMIVSITLYSDGLSYIKASFLNTNENINLDLGRQRLNENFFKENPVTNKYPFKKSTYIKKILSDEFDNSKWILENYPKIDIK